MKLFIPAYPVFRILIFSLLCFFLFEGCANIVPPGGGPKDLTPPELLSIKPADSSLHKKISKIELYFNKFMVVQNLENNLRISPLLPIKPTVLAYGKRVEIKITDTFLQDNTTYRLSLGNALVDNRESTPYKNFVYIFSTGAYFDSLQLQGRVFDAATGLPDSAASVMLYADTTGDSSVLRQQPVYAQKVDSSGYFSFSLLPQKAFRAYAVQDENNNHLYDFGTEKIDFTDHQIMPTVNNDSFLVFNVFKEHIDTTITTTDSTEQKSTAEKRFKKNKPDKDEPAYRVNVDTTNPANRTFELTQALTIDLNVSLSSLDSSRVYLSYDDSGIDVQAVQQLTANSEQIKVQTSWLENKLYTLRLVKGWAKDTSGAELPPGKYIFRTKRSEDYSTLKIHIDSAYVGDQYLLYVYRGQDSVYQKPVNNSAVSIPLLQPGIYGMHLIVDKNKNRKWDSGNFFKRAHAEKVIPYPESIVLKAGWENEVDFKKQEENTKQVYENQESKFSGRGGQGKEKTGK